MNNMKKIFIFILAVFLSITTPVFASNWFDEAFDYCLEHDIVPYDTYKTDGYMARGEAADLLNNAMRRFYFNRYYPPNPFSDLNRSENLYVDSMIKMYYTGVFKGSYDENGNLLSMKDEYVTREQTAALLVRTYGFEAADSDINFIDADRISDYALKDIKTCINLGIISGYEDGSFRAQNPVSKMEFINLIYRADAVADADNKYVQAASFISGEMITDDVKITITNEKKIKYGDTIYLEFENVSDQPYLYNPSDFQIEKEIDGQWIVQRFALNIDSNGWMLNPHSKRSCEVELYNENYNLSEGEYRMVYIINEDSDYSAWIQPRKPPKYSFVEIFLHGD